MARFFPAMYMTDAIVGAGRSNNIDDVKVIQSMLAAVRHYAPVSWLRLPALNIDGRWSQNLETHILRFQQTDYSPNGFVVDGIIHPMRITQGDLKASRL